MSQAVAFPGVDEDQVGTVRIDGGLFVNTAIPILDRGSSVAGFAQGMFAVSPAVATQIRAAVLRNVFFAVAIVVTVADVFDALTSARPYKKPLDFDDPMVLVEQGHGSYGDPAILDALARVARGPHERYSGREGEGIRQELADFVAEYFSVGMETLRYGDGR